MHLAADTLSNIAEANVAAFEDDGVVTHTLEKGGYTAVHAFHESFARILGAVDTTTEPAGH